VFRTRSNDRNTVVETVFSYFRNIDLQIADISLLVKMISTFDKKTDITITISDNNVIFTDGYQRTKVAKLNNEFIDNKYISDEEMNKIFLENFDIDKPFIKETLPKAVVCNINKITRELKTNMISIKHVEGDISKGYLYIS
jgi:2-hydroxy-3-keto-5-methylthiopentenyl-1-phosphate phosphatase